MTNNDKLSEALELAREIRGATAPRSVTAEMVGGCLEALADHGRELSQKQAAMARGWAQASTDINVFAAPDEIPLTSPVGLHGEWAASGQPRPGYSFLLITGGLTLQGIVNGVTSGGGLLRISLDFGSLAFGQGLAYSLECDVRTDTPKYAACLRRERIPAAGAYAHTAAVVFDTGTDENARRVNDDAWSALMSYDCHLPSAVLVGVRHKEVTRYGLFFFGGENNITVCDEDGWDVYHIVRGDDGTTLTHWNDLRRVVGRILSLAARLDPADPGAEAMLTCTSGNAVHYIPASDFVRYVRDTLDSPEYNAFLKLGETASTAYPGDKGAKLREDVDALRLRIWELHDRDAIKEKLMAIGYSAQEAENALTGYPGMTQQMVALREGLATINYSPREIEDCMEDVPELTHNDIAYAKTLMEAYDPTSTVLNGTWKGDTRLVVFPHIDTSAVRTIDHAWSGCGNLRFMPRIDTSAVTTFAYPFYQQGVNTKIRRVYDFDYSSAITVTMGMSGSLPDADIFPEVMEFPRAISVRQLFHNNRVATSYPRLEFGASVRSIVALWQGAARGGVIGYCKGASDLGMMYFNCANARGLSGMTVKSSGSASLGRFFASAAFDGFPHFDLVDVTDLGTFCAWGAERPPVIPDLSAWQGVKSFEYFCHRGTPTSANNIERVEGLNLASAENVRDAFGRSDDGWNDIRYLRILNLGKGPCTDYGFSGARYWGMDSEAQPDARLSLVGSLITDSFDRAGAGMPPATIRLHRNTMSVLTAEEKARITAKGFTLTSDEYNG